MKKAAKFEIGQIVYFGRPLQPQSGIVIEEGPHYVVVNEIWTWKEPSQRPETAYWISKDHISNKPIS